MTRATAPCIPANDPAGPSLERRAVHRDADVALYEMALELSSDGIVFVDQRGVLTYRNGRARELLGVEVGEHLSSAIDGFDREAPQRMGVLVARRSGAPILLRRPGCGVIEASGIDGAWPFVVSPLPCGSADALVGFATRDSESGLFNRDAFEEIAASRETAGGPVMVIALGIDRYGVLSASNRFARDFAGRLRGVVPPGASCARLDGGVFAVLLPEGEHAIAGLEAIHRALSHPLVVSERPMPISVSMGVARRDGDSACREIGVSRAAEIALRDVQGDGGGRIRVCTEELLDRAREEEMLERDMSMAILDDQITVHYQPKVSCSDRRVVGFEALARWNHPRLGMVSPSRFIPLAERNGMISEIGRRVFAEVCRQIAAWRADGLTPCPVSVNVSPTQLLTRGIADIMAPLRSFDVPYELIEVEITESAMMDALQPMGGVLDALRAARVRVAIDDFGTGHSSLANLRKLPVDTLKIDRSFVIDIERSREARDIASTVVAMAKALHLDVVAEGVETEAQARFLADQGVRVMQGYLFSPAVPAVDAARWMAG